MFHVTKKIFTIFHRKFEGVPVPNLRLGRTGIQNLTAGLPVSHRSIVTFALTEKPAYLANCTVSSLSLIDLNIRGDETMGW